MTDYSTKIVSAKLLNEIKEAIHNLNFGSVEIYVVNNQVTQITRRHIRKTNNNNQGLTKSC